MKHFFKLDKRWKYAVFFAVCGIAATLFWVGLIMLVGASAKAGLQMGLLFVGYPLFVAAAAIVVLYGVQEDTAAIYGIATYFGSSFLQWAAQKFGSHIGLIPSAVIVLLCCWIHHLKTNDHE